MATVYSYLRFSSKRQSRGHSSDRQLDKARTWLEQHPEHQLDLTLSMHDKGLSGYHGDNIRSGELGVFIAAARDGKIERGSILLCERMNRFSRKDTLFVCGLLDELVSYGIEFHTLSGQVLTDENRGNLEVVMPIVVEIMLAHEESKQKADYAKKKWAKRRELIREGKKIKGGDCPAWLEWQPDKQDYRVIPEAKKAILYIYKQTAKGVGQRQLVKMLNSKYEPITKAKSWTPSYLSKILTSRQLLGEYQPQSIQTIKINGDTVRRRVNDGPAVAGYFPQVVPDDLFYQAQARRKSKSKHRGSTENFVNLFSGLIHFNDGFAAHPVKHHASGTRRLTSYGKRQGIAEAAKETIDYCSIEKLILGALHDLPLDQLQTKPPTANRQAIIDNQQHLAGIEGRLQELQEALKTGGKAVSAIAGAINDLEAEKEKLQTTLNKLKQVEFTQDQKPLEDLQTILARGNQQDQQETRLKLRDLIAALVAKITIEPHKQPNGRVHATITVDMTNGTSRFIAECTQASEPEHSIKWQHAIPADFQPYPQPEELYSPNDMDIQPTTKPPAGARRPKPIKAN